MNGSRLVELCTNLYTDKRANGPVKTGRPSSRSIKNMDKCSFLIKAIKKKTGNNAGKGQTVEHYPCDEIYEISNAI